MLKMKRSTCKVLLWLGIIWLVIVLIINLIGIIIAYNISKEASIGISLWLFLLTFLLYGLPGIILIIIAIAKWNSEKEKSLKDKTKVSVHIKGKMKDLK